MTRLYDDARACYSERNIAGEGLFAVVGGDSSYGEGGGTGFEDFV